MTESKKERVWRGDELALETRLSSERLAASVHHHQWGAFSATRAKPPNCKHPDSCCSSWKMQAFLAFTMVRRSERSRKKRGIKQAISRHLISG